MTATIVHLEDQTSHCRTAKDVLERRIELTYLPVSSMTQYRESLRGHDVDLVLASVSGSSYNGLEALAYLREHYPEIPFVFFTTDEEKASLLQRRDLDVWSVISTSEPDTLWLCVSSAIAAKRRHAGLQLELARAKELLLKSQKSIAMGRLLGSIAHEINNPLEAIANLLFIAQRNSAKEEQVKGCVEKAEEELQRVSEITKQMLRFHRDSATIQEVLVTETLESVLALHKARCQKQHIEIVRRYECSGILIAHPGELRQSFSNIISNALDSMPQGGRLILRVREHPGKPAKLCITIADTGLGMEREVRHRLGELYFTTKGEAGTGLGLWVTYQLLRKYGTLRVYSSTRPGRSGTVFYLCFPEGRACLIDGAADSSATPGAGSSPGEQRNSRRRPQRRHPEWKTA